MKIEIEICETYDEASVSNLENNITFRFNSVESYKNFLNNPNILQYEFFNKKKNKAYMWLRKNFNKIFSSLKSLPLHIIINGECKESYTELPSQQILFNIKIRNLERIKEIIKSLPSKNCLFQDAFNIYDYMEKEKLLLAYEKIDELVSSIKHLNLSPVELLYIIYDFSRSRVYKKANSSNGSISRDLAHVLLEDEIVCEGFANIFCCLALSLNIYTEPFYWTSQNGIGHKSVIAYINDSKYDIHGVYAFDPTSGCKKTNNDTDYVNNIISAFVPLYVEIENKKAKKMSPELTTACERTVITTFYDSFERLKSFKVLLPNSNVLENEYKLCMHYLNRIFNLIGAENPFLKEEIDFDETLYIVSEMIPLKTLEELIRNARLIEHQINPELYPIDEKTLNDILQSSASYSMQKKIMLFLKRLKDNEK